MKQLVLATHNKHKAEELQALLDGTDIEILTLDNFPHVGDIEEDHDTLEGNALKKARAVLQLTSLPSLADDTGLEVFSLNGEPGVYSARYAGPNATYADNVRRLLLKMDGMPAHSRAAQFRSVLAFVTPEGIERVVEGVCSGEIINHPRGTGGFGYDPVFLPSGHRQTFAEMRMDAKNTVSHRAKALEGIRSVLLSYFNS
ncbi:MAG: RdgB/HAM1 family non-canonical purine NTP pyrophosphatase [Bacteroidetes bacterium]|nr:RdgB/HAM1 family non-canonical purine NTP pyrophosphatase [Bacteroidota bacterium]MCW5894860.1 RdgB/HAM1 family non-canonical purine NTP pyrophosphatase [Bacteroidota bacterium]